MKKVKEAIYELCSFAIVMGTGYLMLCHFDTVLLWGCEKSIELRHWLGF